MAMDGYTQYQQNQLFTASPSKLLLMAYDGAIRFLRTGREKMQECKYDEQSIYINKALAIVAELISTLKEDVDPVLTARLKSIYIYVIEKMAQANMNQDEKALNEVIKILSDLRETWAEADRMLQEQAPREAVA